MVKERSKIQLRYHRGRFVVGGCSYNDGEFEMVIHVGWDGEELYRYRFVEWLNGEPYEVLTKSKFQQRLDDIAEHEGDEAAAIWKTEQNQVIVHRDDHPVFELQSWWEAIARLGLMSLPVSYGADPFKRPLSESTIKKMEAASQRAFEKAIKEDY